MVDICPSGDWACLNEHLAEIYRLLLTKLDNRSLEGMNALNQAWKNEIESNFATFDLTLKSVDSTVANLTILYSDLNDAFISHTGLPASSGHDGL